MANVGNATLIITPKFDGLTDAINRELGNASAATAAGRAMGDGYTRGFDGSLVKAGVLGGVFSTVTGKAMQAVSSHVGSATARLDTLKNYPTVMESLGYSSESAQESIDTMSDRLSNLPTRLDAMAGTVQGITAITGDLDKSTKVGLALNDMMLAGGQGQQLVNSAMEQFRQILAKGKPELQDWRALTQAAPGQMEQLAKAMLGPTANANDLYAALGGGHNEATISMDELMDAIVTLDTEGGDGISSFREQAETAAGGIQTAMDNTSNAITKGLANVMDEIGRDTIADALGDVKTGINEAFEVARDVVREVKPIATGLWDIGKAVVGALGKDVVYVVGGLADALSGLVGVDAGRIAAVAGAFLAFNTVQPLVSGLAGKLPALANGVLGLAGIAEKAGLPSLADGFLSVATSAEGAAGVLAGPWGIAIAAGVALLAGALIDAKREHDEFNGAVEGLSDATGRATALVDYRGNVEGAGEAASVAALSVDDLTQRMQEHADAVNGILGKAEENVATLSTAQDIIHEYAGQTDLSTDAQGRLEWAISQVNEQLGLNIDAQDVANGQYEDANGNVQDLIGSIDELIEKKQQEAKVNALTEVLTQDYKDQYEAQRNLEAAQSAYNDKAEEYAQTFRDRGMAADEVSAAVSAQMANERELNEQLDAAQQAYDGLTSAVDADSKALGMLVSGADEVKSVLAAMGDGVTGAIPDIDAFSTKLADAGVSTATLNEIGSENLAALASACGGNMDAMVWYIQNYNATPIVDKDGNVNVDAVSLIDAQGGVYTWNGTALVDKDGNVAVADTQLTDAQGNLWTWNGTDLESKDGSVSISESGVEAAIEHREDWNSGTWLDKAASATISITRTISDFFSGASANAAGGVRMHADGGYIVSRATVLPPIDIAGEAGAEAIIPLENPRYSQPLVDRIVDGVDGRRGGDAALLREILAAVQSIDPALYVNGRRLAGELAADSDRAIGRNARRATLGR